MTDEQLIEEAAKAMAPPLIFDGTFTEYSRAYDNHRVSDRDADQEYWLILARAAFAVFEKVHAPSDALSDTRVVYWLDCDCEWRTKYCDQEHTRSARVPLAALRAAYEARGEGR